MNITAISSYSIRNNMYNRPAFKSSDYDKFDRSEWANNIGRPHHEVEDIAADEPNINEKKIRVERTPYYKDYPASPLGIGYVVLGDCDLDTTTGELCRRK